MAIYRVHKKNDYTMINNYLIKDKNLKLKDKGMLLVLLSLPDNWNFSVSGLETICNEAKNTINGILNNLEENGYLERKRIYEKNKIVDWQYDIYEIPKLLYRKNEDIKNEYLQNEPQLNTNKERTNKSITNNNKEIYKEIINYLNLKLNTHYKDTTPKTQSLINARLKEGFSVDDFKKVIDTKYDDWYRDKKMFTYLRPETLFSNKFENYLNQRKEQGDSREEILKYLEEMEKNEK